jgi:hypothetical protein
MKGFGVCLQLVSHRLIVWLVSTSGTLLLLAGTFTLAASASIYLSSTYDQPAQVWGRVPAAVTPVPAQCTHVRW